MDNGAQVDGDIFSDEQLWSEVPPRALSKQSEAGEWRRGRRTKVLRKDSRKKIKKGWPTCQLGMVGFAGACRGWLWWV